MIELFHRRIVTFNSIESGTLISESANIFSKIHPDFKLWNLNERKDVNKKRVGSYSIYQYEVPNTKTVDLSYPHLYSLSYPIGNRGYLFTQEEITEFCANHRDLLIGDYKISLFYFACRNEIVTAEVRSFIVDGKAELEVRPIKLGCNFAVTIPAGGMEIFIIDNATFVDGTKASGK